MSINYLLKLYNKLANRRKSGSSYPVIYNVNGLDESSCNKRALFIYIVKPFLLDDDDPYLLRHHHSKQSIQIAKILGEAGFPVDVVDIRDNNFEPSKDYSLVICNRERDIRLINKDARKIYLATTLPHKTHNENLRRRHALHEIRCGRRIKVRRMYPESMPYVDVSSGIISIGNDFITSKWREVFNGPIYSYNNYGFKETEFIYDSKDFTTARRNFLYFASGSQMQKGLDLLLEIFPKHPDLHLYICSDYEKEKDFCDCYHKELYETANIHPLGRITVNGPEYSELVGKCAYVITPSCSDGQSGSVVQCMYSGLIPLVTKEVGIDTEDFGITFTDDSLEEIERVILQVSELHESWHRQRSLRTRRVSEEKYSEDAFINRWRYILGEIINSTVTKTLSS